MSTARVLPGPKQVAALALAGQPLQKMTKTMMITLMTERMNELRAGMMK